MFSYNGLTDQQLKRFTQFAEFLRGENQKYNLTRITDEADIYTRHFADSLEGLGLMTMEGPARLLDLGSGPGFPGLALAIARAQWQITSVEATGKKAAFQQQVVDLLGLTNVRILPVRAETLAHTPGHRNQYDIVTARAVSHLQVLAELALPFVKPGGHLIAYKGPDVDAELAQSQNALKTLNAQQHTIHTYTRVQLAQKAGLPAPDHDGEMNLIDLKKEAPCPKAYPRAYGQIKKKPL
ncbi:MAG: 16S rRNA (guanine(527)-N(7))-methyltransferase RsmG [Phycisphaeraceae bacterium]|nr:16S rRNA (guanine(527)-N(7))-methyltransferase RsmG [Phycisphaeraceae bacterium]